MPDDSTQQQSTIADLLRRSSILQPPFSARPIIGAPQQQPQATAQTAAAPPPSGAPMATPSSMRPAMVAPSIVPAPQPSPAQQDVTKARTKLDTDTQSGSGISHLQQRHPIWGGIVRGLDIAGSILAPRATSMIPGSTLNHQVQLNQDQSALKNAEPV